MLIETALAIEIQRTNPKLSDEKARSYAGWVMEEAVARQLDPWVLHGLVYTESRWTAGVVRKEGDGTCSVGLGQINVKCTDDLVQPLRDPHENLQRVGAFLDKIRTHCKYRCEGIGWLWLYNAGSKGYLQKIERVVQRCHATYDEPGVREVHPSLYVPGVLRPADCGSGAERWVADRGSRAA